jgi:pimeloyl-[acyl-carrier protein] methyl ester esterase
MHIERTGTGPDLVLLHGWAMHGGIFMPLADVLRDRWTVHVVDLPGHGHSRDDATPLNLSELAAALARRLPRAVWLGWSLGGLIAQKIAIDAPEKVRALTIVAGSPRFVKADDWPHGVEHDVFRAFEQELASDWRGTVERFLALEVIGSEWAREALRVLQACVFDRGEPAPHVLADGLDLLDATDLRAGIAGLSVPSAWITGRRDRLVPPSAVHAGAELAGGRFVEIAGAGHAPFLHHAEAIAAAVSDVAETAA